MSGHEKPTYAQAFAELEGIIREMEADDADIDALAEKVKRAATLLRLCKRRLRKTEEDVKNVLAGLEDESAAADGGEAEPSE